MKKINNNKFRGNTVYSLNYKFDSVSAAGKISGTALELIKRYNELAKEAQGNGNYVEMEVFRQYAEHYRKIVTEINERKNQGRDSVNDKNNDNVKEDAVEKSDENIANDEKTPITDNGLVETEGKEQHNITAEHEDKRPRRRTLKVVEVQDDSNPAVIKEDETPKTHRRVLKKRKTANAETEQG